MIKIFATVSVVVASLAEIVCLIFGFFLYYLEELGNSIPATTSSGGLVVATTHAVRNGLICGVVLFLVILLVAIRALIKQEYLFALSISLLIILAVVITAVCLYLFL